MGWEGKGTSRIGEYVSRTSIGAYFHTARESRKLVLVIVAIALLLDNMLLTCVVPIIPEYLYQIRHQHDNLTTTAAMQKSTTPIPEMMGSSGDELIEMTESTITTTTLSPEERKHKELVEENMEVGMMFASKAFVQLIANPFVGPLTNKIGYSIPMFCGFIIMFFSTIIFAFGRSYTVLFLARALQGIGSSCSSVSGMGMLAERYPDDKERGNAMGLALGGLALGVVIGPPFGGFMYQFVGKTAPFLVLAFLALADGCLQLLILQPEVKKNDDPAPSLKALISDPYIQICAGAITFANMGIAMLEPSLPLHMMDTMGSDKWELGASFLPAAVSYLIGTNLFGPLGHKMGRWKAALVGLAIIGIALILIPFATKPHQLVIPMAGLGFAIGMVDSSMMPELGNLVDIRHSAVYGGVYAIGDVAFCVGFAVGPALSGSLVKTFGFGAMLTGCGIVCFLYCPLLLLLRDPPGKTQQEKDEDLHLDPCGAKTKVRYNNFEDEVIENGRPFNDIPGGSR